VVYGINVKEICKTETFVKWMKKLKDKTGKFIIASRISRLRDGNPGDFGSIGEGLYEMRIHYGPGYRVYYKDTGREIVILLCGGDKSTQQSDIARAKELAKLPLKGYKEEQNGKNE
jgi:putative addiction module killer protein